jgi:hypothetical protein
MEKLRAILSNFTRKQWAGVVILYLAALGYAAEIIIPFTNLPNKVLTFGVVLVIAEVLFLIGVALVGKPYYHQIKAYLKDFITSPSRKK